MTAIEKTVPATAFALAATEFALGDALPDDERRVPVALDALSGDPVNHWYWGRVVLDLDGMSAHKPKLAVDYCHRDDEIIGYVDDMNTDGKLTLMGALTPVAEGDRASEIVAKSRAGVPYEASILWQEGRVEEVFEGGSAQVNGRTVDGPLYVVREWNLRGVAVCPHGVDPNTTTRFAAGGDRQITITQTGDNPMSEETQADNAAAEEGVSQPAPSDDQAAGPDESQASLADGQRFMQAFGEARGATYFAKGLSFQDAQAQHIEFQSAEIDRLKKDQPANAGATPVPFSAQDDQPAAKRTAFQYATRNK